jgi:hypothetical protein
MLTSSDLLYGVILPFALATIALSVAWQPWKRSRGTPAQWGGPIAAGAAFAATFVALQGPRHVFPPGSAIMWLFYVAVGFSLLGLMDSMTRLPKIVRTALVFVVAFCGAGLLLRFNFTNQTWDILHGAMWLGAIAGVAGLWWVSFEQSAASDGMTAPLAMAAVSGISALIIAVLVEQTTGQAMGAMAIALSVAIVLMIWSGKASLKRGTAMVVAGLGVNALAAAYFISSLPLRYVLLLAFAPAMLWLGKIPAIHRLRPWMRVGVQIVLLLIPLGIAAVLAVQQAKRDAAIEGDPYTLNVTPAWPGVSPPPRSAGPSSPAC